jgi:hypothetical protein
MVKLTNLDRGAKLTYDPQGALHEANLRSELHGLH